MIRAYQGIHLAYLPAMLNFSKRRHEEEEEQRKHRRVPHGESVIITIRSCKVDPSLVGERAPCAARDASVNGLQLALDAPIPEEAELGLDVAFAGSSVSYHLLGRVQWCRSDTEKATHRIGLVIEDRKHTDFPQWREAILGKARFMDF